MIDTDGFHRGRHAGKVAIVTGAGSGIGRATAIRLAMEGARVVGCSPGVEALAETAAAFTAAFDTAGGGTSDGGAGGSGGGGTGGELVVVPADLSVETQLDAVVDATLDRFGRIDIVANNAGISDWFLPAHLVDNDTWDRVLAVNVTAVMAMCRRVLPIMTDAGGGAITNVGSVASFTGSIGGLAYTTSKHAVVGITRSIAWSYQGKGIRCNAVCPGAVDTALDRTANPRDEWGYDRLKKRHRLCERVAAPDEIATVISWLSSREASNLNGAVITADGGWTA